MKIEQGSNLGIKGLRNLGIEGVPPADSGFSAAAGYRSGQFDRRRNIIIHRRVRSLRPIGPTIWPAPRRENAEKFQKDNFK
jgi:hypothetical protein